MRIVTYRDVPDELMIRILLPVLFGLVLCRCAMAQNEASYWVFGQNAGIDFSGGSPVAVGSPVFAAEGTASICDATGNLLFYTDGITVWNMTDQPMPNGFGLTGGNSSSQAALIVKKPSSVNLFYVFTTDDFGGPSGFRYSIVDMTLDAGLGDVTVKNVPIITPVAEKVTSYLKTGTDYVWLVTHGGNDAFYSFLLTDTGLVTTPVISNVGTPYTILSPDTTNAIGAMKISPCGSKLAMSVSYQSFFELFDFNAANGTVSNPVFLPGINFTCGIEFSPDGQLLYGTEFLDKVYQWDINAGTAVDIAASQVVVGSSSPGFETAFLQMAPDGKIYMATNESNFLGVINNPNVPGMGCNYVPSGFNLGINEAFEGLPNFSPFLFASFADSCNVTLTIDLVAVGACDSTGTSIDATATGMSPFLFLWSNGETTEDIDSLSSGTYTVTVTDAVGASIADTIVVTSGATPPSLLFTTTSATCGQPDGSVDAAIANGMAPYTFIWSNGATGEDISGATAGTYTLTVTDVNGCSTAANATVNNSNGPTLTDSIVNATCDQANGSIDVSVTGGSAPFVFAWDNGSTTEDLTNIAAGTYGLTVTDGTGCSLVQSFDVSTTVSPTITFVQTDPTCAAANGGVDITVFNGIQPFTFAWSNGATSEDLDSLSSGNYGVTAVDNQGCNVDTSITLTATAAPSLVLNGLVDSVCVGQSFNISTSGYSNYLWSPALGLSASSGSDVTITVDSSLTYTVIGTGNNCSDTVMFDVAAVQHASVSFLDTFAGCAPLSVELTAQSQNASFVQWGIDGILEANQNPVNIVLAEGLHDIVVIAVSPLGCNDTVAVSDFASVYSSPVAGFVSAFLGSGVDGFAYAFTDSSIAALNYHWDFGDGATDSVASPQHIYTDYGTYVITQTVTNENGCSDTALLLLETELLRKVFVPNTFTPNGDGVNDLFMVYGNGIGGYTLEVYSRWGEHIFGGEGTHPGWDGTFKGQPLNTNTFVYMIELKYVDGQTQKIKGDINLLR